MCVCAVDNVAKLESGSPKAGLIDTHCHLDFIFERNDLKFQNFRAFRQYYSKEFTDSFAGCVAVFCQPSNWGRYEDSISSDLDVWCTFGVHPHFSNCFSAQVCSTLKELLKRERVVALGEIGLDYSVKNHVNHDIQKRTFLLQVHMALERNLAMCLHIRQADEDGLKILEEAKVPENYRIHLHCFNSNWLTCQKWLEKYPNLKVGFTPMIGYAGNKHLQEVVSQIPLSRILLETDSPYFLPRQKPTSLSGKSHPGFVIYTATDIAAFKGIMIQDVIEANRRNVQEIYNI